MQGIFMKVTIDRMQCVTAVRAGIRARRSLCRMKRTRFRRSSKSIRRKEYRGQYCASRYHYLRTRRCRPRPSAIITIVE